MANGITSMRMVCSMALLFFPALSAPFYAWYLAAGVTDMIDGAVARKTNTVSEFGSKLDTAADFVFVAVCLIKLMPVLPMQTWMYIATTLIALVKAINLVAGCIKQKKVVVVHSMMNKLTGAFLFVLPLTVRWVALKYSAIVVCIVAAASAVHESFVIFRKRNGTYYDVSSLD